MKKMTIELPISLEPIIDQQSRATGHKTPARYIEALVRAIDQRRQERLEALLLEGLEGESTPFTRQDWENIRRQVREHAKRREAV